MVDGYVGHAAAATYITFNVNGMRVGNTIVACCFLWSQIVGFKEIVYIYAL